MEPPVQLRRKLAPDGPQALPGHRKPPGGPAKLTAEQRRRLPELLAQGPAAYGFDGAIWTRQRVAQVRSSGGSSASLMIPPI